MKKILSLALVLVLMLSCFAGISVSAAEEDTTIYFQVPDDWNNYSRVFCYIWEYDGENLMGWQAKAGKCEDLGNKLYSYDVSKVGGLEPDKFYCVIFSVNTGLQTYDLLLSTDCYGDIAYCDGTTFENPADSNKTAIAAYWENQNKTTYGPIMAITSIGNVVGTCPAPGETPQTLFEGFIAGPNLENAQIYSGKNDQKLIDDIIAALGITSDEAAAIIEATGVTVDWENTETTTPDETTPDEDDSIIDDGETTNLYLGDADLSGGSITVKDATIIQKHIAGFEVAINLACADVDQNEVVNIKDATTIQKFIAGLPVDAQIGMLLGENETPKEEDSALDPAIFGSWEGTTDIAEVLNAFLPMFSDEPLVLEYINIETCPIKQIYTFNEDGTYTLIIDEASTLEAMTTVKAELRVDIENFLVAYAEQKHLPLTPEQMIQLYGYESIDAFMEEMMPLDMIEEGTAPTEGTYTTVDGKIILDEYDTGETYTIDGDTLTINAGTDSTFPDLYPLVLTKVK